jgi:hypothetical protein
MSFCNWKNTPSQQLSFWLKFVMRKEWKGFLGRSGEGRIKILPVQGPLWEGDQEVVKRSGRDEPMWVAIHTCMEAMLGISLYSCLYLKLAKTLCLYYLLCFLFNKIQEQEGGTRSATKHGGRQTMYTQVSKCKNDKIKKIKILPITRVIINILMAETLCTLTWSEFL